MANDSTPYLRPAVLGVLATAAAVTDLIPAERHYPGQRPPNPVWPFLAYGSPSAVPFTASGLDGATVSVAVHVYAATSGQGEDTVPGEDFAAETILSLIHI